MRHSHRQGLFNGSILVAEHGSLLHSGAFGLANRKTLEPLRANSVFYLASVSKQLTAMAILILEKQKRLSLQDRLSEYFPAFPDYSKQISIEHLLTHTSGIPDHFRLGLYKPGFRNQDVVQALIGQDSLDFEPGERFSYSNGGYVLLSLIVEKASGEPFHSFLKKNIFDPLGMSHSLVYDESKPFIEHRAVGYDGSGNLADYDTH